MLLEHGPLTESQVSALVSCVDHPKNQRISIVDKSLGPTVHEILSFAFPTLHADLIDALSSSILTSIAHQLTGEVSESTSAQLY